MIIGYFVRYLFIKYSIDNSLLFHPVLFPSLVGISSSLSISFKLTIEMIFTIITEKEKALLLKTMIISALQPASVLLYEGSTRWCSSTCWWSSHTPLVVLNLLVVLTHPAGGAQPAGSAQPAGGAQSAFFRQPKAGGFSSYIVSDPNLVGG